MPDELKLANDALNPLDEEALDTPAAQWGKFKDDAFPLDDNSTPEMESAATAPFSPEWAKTQTAKAC